MDTTKELPFREVKKVLIRSANWIGDAVMSLPAVASIRFNFPRAEIFILAKPWVAEIFQNNSLVDQVILYQSPGVHEGLWGMRRLVNQIKKEKFDLALLLQNAFEAAVISFLARIPLRAGYNTDGRSLLLTHPVTRDRKFKELHQTDYYLDLLQSLGCRLGPRNPELSVSEAPQKEADSLLKILGIGKSEPLVGISPGATYGPAKQWLPEKFAELADRVTQNLGVRVLLFGSRADRKTASLVVQKARVLLGDLTGLTTLAQAIALISRCRLFISNDSGLMHVAAALRVPLIAIFGSTDPKRTGPRGENCRVVRKPVPCSPCLKAECRESLACMSLISVDQVYEEAVQAWQRKES